MGNKPLLSICIPTYNRMSYLRENICEFEKQISEFENPEEIEIVISDNCSTDQTQKVIEKLKNKFLNIKYKKNKQNIGAIKNILEVINRANGEYIWLFGDDDLPVKGALLKIIEIIEKNPDISYLIMDINTLSPEGLYSKKLFFPKILDDKMFDSESFFKNYLYACGFLSINIIKRERALRIINNKPVYNMMLNTGWPQVILASLVIDETNQAYLISSPQVIKRDGNLIFGPKQYINLYIIDVVRLIEFLHKLGVKGIRTNANYPYMIDLKLFKILFLYYLYTDNYIKLDYFREIVRAANMASILNLKLRLILFAGLFLIPKKVGEFVVHLYYLLFKSKKKYYYMQNKLQMEAKKFLDYQSGKLELSIRTYCKNEIAVNTCSDSREGK